MVLGAAAEHAVALALEHPNLSVGLHFDEAAGTLKRSSRSFSDSSDGRPRTWTPNITSIASPPGCPRSARQLTDPRIRQTLELLRIELASLADYR